VWSSSSSVLSTSDLSSSTIGRRKRRRRRGGAAAATSTSSSSPRRRGKGARHHGRPDLPGKGVAGTPRPEGEEQVASTAELRREEAEAEKRRAVDLAAGARLLRLAWVEATGWRALPLLLTPSVAGRGGEAGRRSAWTGGGDEFFLLFFLDWRRGSWRTTEMQKAPPPGNAACRRPPLILQQPMQQPLGALQ
jgi:hypothetical protein